MIRKTVKALAVLILISVIWYYAWAHYVEDLPHSSPYYDATHNPIPDAFGEKPLLATAGFCKFAQSATIAVALPVGEALKQARAAIENRFGIEATDGGIEATGAGLEAFVRGRPYPRTPELAKWKAKNGSSKLLVQVSSAHSVGIPAATFVEVERVDRFDTWPGRDFHTGILFAIPIRMTVTQAVVTNEELNFLMSVFGSSASDTMFLCPSVDISDSTPVLKALAEKAAR